MEPMPDLNAILDAMKQMQTFLAEAAPNTEDPELKHMVSLLTQDLESQRAELVQLYPQVMREFEQEDARLDAVTERLRKESAELQATLAAMDAEVATAPSPAAPPPAAAPRKAPATGLRKPAHAADDSVWKDDNMSTWESGTQATEAPPPAPPAARPAAWNPDESVRDLGEAQGDQDDPEDSR